MSTRLRVRLVMGCILLLIVALMRIVHPNRVTFSPANMSIDPGKGWKKLEVSATATVCTPRLVSKSGMIGALLLDEDLTELKAAAAKVQDHLMAAGKVPAGGCKQEEFTTPDGLAIIHLSYTGTAEDSNTPNTCSHYFLARNLRGRCVSVTYVTSPELESSNVIAAISKTLRVE